MKIKRIIAAVTALVLIGGAYTSFAEGSRNIGKTYAADAAKEDNVGVTNEDEKAPSFSVEKETCKKREPYSVIIKNVDPASITFGGQNFVELQRSSAEDGSLVYTFMSRSSGEVQLIVNYGFDGEIRHKEFNFNILEEEYEDENYPRFSVENDTYKRREPYSVTIKNVDPASITTSGTNIFDVNKSTDENGNIVLTFMSKESGEANLVINYGFDGEIRHKEFSFNILEEEYEDENYPRFSVENDTYKRREPYSVTIKNVDPASITTSGTNIFDVNKSTDENGNIVLTFMSKESGEANLVINYGFDGEIRHKEFSFNILEEEYEDENYPRFSVENDTYKRREPYSVTIKNVDPASITTSGTNIFDVNKSTDENGNIVLTFMSKESGEANLVINYGFDGEIRHKEFSFNILEEEYEDENYPRFSVENDTYKRREPYSVTIKNVDPASITTSGTNIFDVNKSTDENGNIVLTFMSKESGAANLVINYGFDGEIRHKEFSFNILEEEYEDENYPRFSVENDTYKRREPYSVTIKNVDPASITTSGTNIFDVNKSTDENGNIVLTFMSKESGEANLVINYGFDGEIRHKEFNFNILEEEYEDENYPRFSVENDTYKRREPYSVTIKNVDPASITTSGTNIFDVNKSTDENGNIVLTFMSKESGEANLVINYGFDGEIRHKEFNFNILEEEYEDENYPRFSVENDTYKRREPYSVTIKNVDPASITTSGTNIFDVNKSTDGNGNIVLTFMSKESGEANLVINYGFDGEIRHKEFSFNILEEEYEEETSPQTGLKGDANCDGSVDMGDVVLIMQALANPNKYGVNGTHKLHITQQGVENSDVDTTVKGLTVSDALKIQKYLLDGKGTL
ncbi:dockerin type I repeat-containing protein [Ruminococcus flavefaciens]|uniref:dockerin type I repeat-containing protein n=1 Tax=Ruminococcus flavefaciens TaxID=1265 RepID=UPI000464CD35|nr:dockerin type I repeat-containing protein [Ruminococcus flavefaciens]